MIIDPLFEGFFIKLSIFSFIKPFYNGFIKCELLKFIEVLKKSALGTEKIFTTYLTKNYLIDYQSVMFIIRKLFIDYLLFIYRLRKFVKK